MAAVNGTSPSYGNPVMNFITAASPMVSDLQSSGVTPISATLNATVNPNGVSTPVEFQYSTDSTFATGTTTVAASPATVNGSQAAAVLAIASGLVPGTTYYTRAVAPSAGPTTTRALRPLLQRRA